MSKFDEALEAIEFNKSVVVNDAAIAEIVYWNQIQPYMETIRTSLTQAAEIERGDKVVVDRREVEGWWEMDCAPRNQTLFVCRKKSKPHVTFEAAFFKWEIPEEYLVLQKMTIDEPLDDCWTNYQWKPLITASEGK